MASPVLQFKRGAFANLPGLRAGEPALTTDTHDLYVGIDSSIQNNKFFGSHRYWSKENGTTSLQLKLVDKGGSNSINLKSPNTLSGITTYTLPETITAGYFLRTNSLGVLDWSNEFPSIGVTAITAGIATFTDPTDNTLGNADTGAVQIDGGLGVNKNVTIGGNLNVQGYSEFVGVVTFKGGTINLGDSDTDDIVVAGEFKSNLTPTDDATYDLGNGSKRWRHASFSGVGTFATGAVADAIRIGITGASEIDTSSGNLTLDSAGGQTIIDDNLSVTGVSTFTGAIDANGGLDVSGGESVLSSATVSDLTSGRVVLAGAAGSLEDSGNLTFGAGGLTVGAGGVNVTGVSTFSTDVVIGGDVRINGNDIKSSTGDTAITLSGNDVALADNLTVAGVSTFTGAIDANGGLDVSGGETVLSSATVSDLTSGRVVLAGAAGALQDSGNLTFGAGGLTVGTGGVNVTGVSTFSADVTVGGDLQVTGNDIKSSTGVVAITLADNDVTVADDLTVNGNLYVNGSTTQVNTQSLTVEDRTIDLGIVNGAAPSTNTTWDLGVLFNYYSSGAAKKSAVVWEHNDSRFKFASVLGADTNGTDSNTPQLSVTTFAPIEIAELWVNNSCTGGTQQVIGCVNSELALQNIVVDAGTF